MAFAQEGDPLRTAERQRDNGRPLEALELTLPVARSPKEKAARRCDAFRLAADAYDSLGCPRQAMAVCEEGLAALGTDSPVAGALVAKAAYICRERIGLEEASLYLEAAMVRLDLAKLPPDDAARVLALLADVRAGLGQFRAAVQAAESAVQRVEATRKSEVFVQTACLLAGLYARLNQLDKARAVLDKLSGEIADYTSAERAALACGLVAKRLAETGRDAEARDFALRMLRQFGRLDPAFARGAVRTLLDATPERDAIAGLAALDDEAVAAIASEYVLPRLVPIALSSGQAEELVRLCVRAMLARPFAEDDARACLKAILDVRVQQGRLDDALAAAWASYAITGAGESRTTTAFAQAVALVTHALRARDGHLVGANAFGRYQLYGPNGPDRTPATADDIPHPLKGVAFRPEPAVDRLFEAALQAQPPTYDGHRRRGWICLLWCKPDKALGAFKRAFALCSLEPTALARAAQDVALGLKALRATPVGMDAFANFQRLGPAGPDGKAGTADDLKDPLAEY